MTFPIQVHSWIFCTPQGNKIKNKKGRNHTNNGEADLSWTDNSHNTENINWESCQFIRIQHKDNIIPGDCCNIHLNVVP